MLTTDQVNELNAKALAVSQNLILNIGNLLVTRHKLATAKMNMQFAQDTILVKFALDPKGLGSNEQTRDATLRTMCSAEQVALDMEELNNLKDSASVEMEKLNWDFVRFELRALQLAFPAPKED